MIKIRLFICSVVAAIFCLLQLTSLAQGPNLPTKATLSQTLLSGKNFTNGTQVDTVIKQRAVPGEYTLEVVAKVNTATGRGLDIEARNSSLKGFRLSLDGASLKSTAPLTAAKTLSASNSGQNHVIRVAVRNDSAHIYQNGAYLQSQPFAAIKDILNGVETDQLSDTVTGANLVANWAGTAPNNTGSPADYGWAYTGATTTTLFNTANSTSGARFLDITAASGTNVQTYNGSPYVGRVFYIRWDGSAYQNAVYSYPVTLEANTTYDFSMLHSYFSNSTGTNMITVGIGKTTASTDRYDTRVFYPTGTKVLKKEDFYFTSKEAGQYYLTFTGNWALYSIAELSVKKMSTSPRFLFGKNYLAGAVDMEISSATYEDGAWAPSSLITGTKQTVTLTGSLVQVPTSFNTDFIVPGKTDVHLNGEFTPFVNSTIALNSNDAWLFFDNVKPSVVVSKWLDKVTINGVSAAGNQNVRIAVYKNGTAIIPNGNLTSQAALQAFTQTNLAGSSQTYAIEVYNNNLGAFNNSIKSFKLKRGYMATFANNPDGSGFSRVFVANDSDLVVNAMPLGLDATVSFIRVFRWNWPSKKGKAGGGSPVDLTNSTWFYDWNIGGNTTRDYDYSLIRQTQYWPGWGDIGSKSNVNHLLGFNEPDRPDQADMTVEQAIQQWPELMKSGLRIGSPAPATPSSSWISNFMNKCDSLNYRVDYVAIHCYWGGLTPQQWYSQLKAIYDRVKRPLWITEWNNGANWTTETWPTDPAAQFQKQYNDMIGILNVLDTTSFIERYAEYDWVENKRALVLADTLTAAGKYYAANKSDFAYNPSKAYVHNWKLAAPSIYSSINNNDYFKVTLSWNELNGELGSKYILERKVNGRDADFVSVQEFTGYAHNSGMSYVDSVFAKATYRLKAIALDGTTFVYSGSIDVIGDNAPVAPTTLTGEVISSSKIRLNWNAGTNVRSYNLKRSLNATGPFDLIIAPRTAALTFLDENLTPATTYYYVVTTLNTAGESANSTVLSKTTPALLAPVAVLNPRISSGDTRITLTWDFIYDAKYAILRSLSPGGTYDTIATNLETLRYRDNNKINNTTYYYKIVAYNAVGTSPQSPVLVAKPILGQHLHVGFDENTGTLLKDDWGGYNGTSYKSVVGVAGKDSATGGVKLVKDSSSYIQLADSVVSTLNDFTIAAWFKMPANQGNNTRLFDFGTSTTNFMMLSPRIGTANGPGIRYKITAPTGTNDRYISYELPLEAWVHVVISQQGSVFKFYVNGSLKFSDSNVTVKPADMGVTNQNYLGRSVWSTDPYCDHTYDDFKIFNYAMSDLNVYGLFLGNQVLPVQLTTFEGKATAEGNLLNWHTATEINNDYFELQRAIGTPLNFESIVKLKGKGNSVLPNDYRYLDANLKTGMYYYRLKQVNFDGRSEYSRTISIESKKLPQLRSFPNPVSSFVTVELASSGSTKMLVRVFNTMGQQVLEQKESVLNGTLKVDLSRLAAGIYEMKISNETINYSFPVIKQ